jgi:O-acetyl-ADP-ribose deacetylase (regulator of RNase III)
MKEITDNLLDLAEKGEFDIIAQGCNCFHTMGSGIAKDIHNRYPEVYDVDKKGSIYGSKSKLGTCTYTKTNDFDFIVFNCYTQHRYGADGAYNRYVEYGAVRSCMKEIKQYIQNTYNPSQWSEVRIGLPLIGCGRAGGSWNVVKEIYEEEFKGYNLTVVHFNG